MQAGVFTDANVTVIGPDISLVKWKKDVLGGTTPDVCISYTHKPGVIEGKNQRGVFLVMEGPHGKIRFLMLKVCSPGKSHGI